MAHALLAEQDDGLGTVGLDAVAHHDMAGIHAIDSHMNNGAHAGAAMPLGTHSIHQLGIAHTHSLPIDPGSDALAGYLLYIGNQTTVDGFIGERFTQRGTYRMGGKVLYVGGQVQQVVGVEVVGMHGLDIELPAGKRTRLVEHHGIYLVQRVYIITALDKDAAT